MTMRKVLLAGMAVLALAGTATASQQEPNVLFICNGKIEGPFPGGHGYPEFYSIKQEHDPNICDFYKGPISKQIFRVCRLGDRCIVSGKGDAGHDNQLFRKVFEVQHAPPE
jgi:hypothetical protein